jgi:hypothetical protein
MFSSATHASKIQLTFGSSKCSKFVLGKKSAIGDKPAVKRHEKPISWDRLPFAAAPILTTEDVEIQKARVRFYDVVITQFPDHSAVPRYME